jgi:hypothetical protein
MRKYIMPWAKKDKINVGFGGKYQIMIKGSIE